MTAGPLTGCRVLDLGIITAGASTSALLADLGADVIKVESPGYIDPFRAWDKGLGAADWWDQSRFFQFTNRNKRGMAIDLKQAEGRDLFLQLVDTADVLVENFRRGVLDRLGLGWPVLSARNAGLILCSVTSQGETGPDAGAATYGSTLEGTSGLSDMTRDAAGNPQISGVLLNYPDQIVSIYAAGIVTLAVMEKRRSGRGARLDISQRELASFLLGEHILAATAGGPVDMDGASARVEPVLAGDGAGPWHLLHGADLTPLRVANGDDILTLVQHGGADIAFSRTPEGADVKGLAFSHPSGLPLAVNRAAPRLGEHNREVLRDLLGLDEATISALERKGVLGSTPRN